MRAPRVCLTVGCSDVATSRGRCADCASEHEQIRGTRQQRGYDTPHDKLRRKWAPKVATGTVTCWRCRYTILADTAWDLGHDDDDRTQYRGPEHATCNRSAGGRA